MDPVALAAGAALGAAALILAVGLQRRGPSAAMVERARVGTEAAGAAARAAEAEERAAASVRDVGVLVDLVGIGVIRVSDDLTVTSANETAARLLARRAAGLPGRSVMEVSTDHRLEEIVRSALQTGAAAGELTIRTPDAPTILVRAHRLSSGDAWLVLEDVTELRRLQRIRTEFIDNLAHELRTPLTTVSLLAETLALEAGDLPPRTADRIAKIEVETGHLVQMVNELLDLSKIESGSAALLLSDVDLARLAGATVERLSLFAERHGVRMVVEADAAIPSVRGDGERLGQALLNILHNAVKFSPAGAAVVVRVRADEQEAVVTVQDHGPGIPRSAFTRVFERFYKGDRARTPWGRRDRAGAFDRPPRRRGARRPDLGRLGGGERLHVRLRRAACRAGPGRDAGRLSMLRLAHRGDHALARENSLAAFVAAIARPGCDGVELDVRSSADGIAIVLHDATLARVQGRPDRADSLTAAQLESFGVPTLAAALAACGPDAFLDVELKEDLGARALGPLVAARGLPDGSLARAVVSAFDPAQHRHGPAPRAARRVLAQRRGPGARDAGPRRLARLPR